ncbi:Leucine Rich Repeat family protein [Trichomonas vaginalis G3]|uniref:Leucine Rich Repeat family protein n=1 Tax=Trichomonas vaginalis (strain ATCC PRA-98 / G3) TaxID=412133 RepID=A2GA80_TRIV3|nr:uncharacterized protein TVAGG3_0260460 [Trichomonas vaginalis G3]EAX85938.1 Leucine Rich Repeat family protein [Trichomonas vaginalis G3]KAI5525069.1 protein serine/threonine phosphatase protein [Trichomonas vaginalis G3]|eukprot:XP_001298868.1 hypothetical protein [Trichomonas vaginalis G3]
MGGGVSKHVFDPNKEVLKINGRNLTDIPFAIPEDHPLKQLDLAQNHIQRIPLKLLNLELLDLSQNDLRQVLADNPDVILEYPKLKTLNLTECNINEYPKMINSLKTIRVLNLDRNYLTQIELDLPGLKSLNLMINYLTEMPPLPPKLLKLNVGFNNLKTLAFSHETITELRLSGNNINYVSPDISFPNAKLVDLSHNHICEFPPIDKLFPKVELLQLTANFLVESPCSLPDTLIKYDISYNMIPHIKEPLTHLVNLTHLDISNNLIDECPDIPPNVKSLTTDHNHFKSVQKMTNQNVRLMILLENQLQELPDLSASKVATLCLNRNEISDISHAERIPDTIQQIELISNKLTTLNLEFLAKENIKTLTLTNNGITTLPKEIVNTKLKALLLGENPLSSLPKLPPTLNCISCNSCKFTEFPDVVYTLTKLTHVDFSCNQITCVATIPSVFVNLNCNQIDSFPLIYKNTQTLLLAHNKLRSFKIAGKALVNCDVSHNMIKEIFLNPSNEIHVIKLAFNPLKYEIDLNWFPNIDSLDICATKCRVLNMKDHKRLQEVAQDYDDTDFIQKRNATIKLFNCHKTVGYYEFIGVRPTMEDSLIMRQINKETRLIAVLDGHAGNKTACVGAFYIPELFTKIGANALLNDIPAIIHELNLKIGKMGLKDGATLALAIVKPDEIGIAHLGDARCVVIRKDGSVLELTVDHKATDRMEYDLLKEKRCFLQFGRVNGTLAVSRTIGDLDLEGVLRIPGMTVHKINKENDIRLLVACDGIFDVLSSAETGKIIAAEPDCARAAAKLVSIAYSRGSADNMSAIVVNLEQQTGFLSKFF